MKKAISVRLDPDLIDALKERAKREGIPYQTLINQILTKELRKSGYL